RRLVRLDPVGVIGMDATLAQYRAFVDVEQPFVAPQPERAQEPRRSANVPLPKFVIGSVQSKYEGMSRSRGRVRSASDRLGPSTGHSIPRSGSFQRMPRSKSGA